MKRAAAANGTSNSAPRSRCLMLAPSCSRRHPIRKTRRRSSRRFSHFKVTTAVGVVEWGNSPIPNVCPTPLIGAQWIKAKPGSKYKLDLVIVDNADDPNVPIGAKLQPYS